MRAQRTAARQARREAIASATAPRASFALDAQKIRGTLPF
jgi:hypothetical protein